MIATDGRPTAATLTRPVKTKPPRPSTGHPFYALGGGGAGRDC